MAEAKTDDDVIRGALDRFRQSQDGAALNRENCESDINFARMSDQWPDKIRKQREAEGRPCLTINKLNALVRHVINAARQGKPGIVVSPIDNGADVETAEIIGGIVRSIERGSNAELAYDTAVDHAVSGGMGFFRIGIEYAHDETFDLEARIERIANPMMVHWDVTSTAFDASDWEYGFISQFVHRDLFKRRYKDAEPVDFSGDNRDHAPNWIDDDHVRIADYYLRTEKQRDIVMLSSGQVIRADHLPVLAKAAIGAGGLDLGGQLSDDELVRAFMDLSGLAEQRRRAVTYHEVVHRIISGVEVLEENPWPGSTIPIVPVWGDEVWYNGYRHFRSLVRDARDPQSMFNFWRSASTELVALAPRAPFIMEERALPEDGAEAAKWAHANARSYAYLMYRSGANIPQRQPFAGVPGGVLQESLSAADDIKAITGIFDSSIGAASNETSGRAILARERQSNTANFTFIDNLNRAIKYAGRVLVDIIPAVYSARQAVRVLGEDSVEKVARLTQTGAQGFQRGPDGGAPLYNLTVGKYDVTVKSGPSYASQREETRETLIEIMRQVPGAAQFVGDVLLEHMDFVGSDKVAKRLKMLLPANIQQAEGVAPPPGMVPGGPPVGAPVPPVGVAPRGGNGGLPPGMA